MAPGCVPPHSTRHADSPRSRAKIDTALLLLVSRQRGGPGRANPPSHASEPQSGEAAIQAECSRRGQISQWPAASPSSGRRALVAARSGVSQIPSYRQLVCLCSMQPSLYPTCWGSVGGTARFRFRVSMLQELLVSSSPLLWTGRIAISTSTRRCTSSSLRPAHRLWASSIAGSRTATNGRLGRFR
jgi:hypothetical protein